MSPPRLLPWLSRTRAALARGAGVVERTPVLPVVAAFVLVEWMLILATGLVARHSGWIYYQGGDQLWYYTVGWLLGHGELTQTAAVGYGLPSLYAPISWLAGPNVVVAYPAIALLNVLVLVPAAMCALYGIGARLGGRIFGYWTLLLWLVVPFVGVLYTNPGYHQRYTEFLLPQAFGLTALADMPTTVATLVAVYFCVRLLTDEAPRLVDGLAAGLAAGAAIAIKPSAALFLAGPALAFVATRRFGAIGSFLAGVAPAVITLALWKERGSGSIPVISQPSPHAGDLASGAPLGGLDLGRYWRTLDWHQFVQNLDGLREHFWSGRLITWIVLAGTIGLLRRSPRLALLVGGWFFAFAVVKGSYDQGNIEDGSLFRLMMPAYPAFLLLIAALPLLIPGVPSRLRAWQPAFATPSPRLRLAALGATVLVTALVPFVAIAAADTHTASERATYAGTDMPLPANRNLGAAARATAGRVELTWRSQRSFGGPVFYRIWRARNDGWTCPDRKGGALCDVTMPEVGVTHATSFSDRPPSGGRWVYRVSVAANWLDDPQYGDVYLFSSPLVVRLP